MDIFTTQLTRVVPIPIKPTSLKVKALLKESANSKLSQDADHLENHEYYFIKGDQSQSEHRESEQALKAVYQDENKRVNDKNIASSEEVDDNLCDKSNSSDTKSNTQHLDLYA